MDLINMFMNVFLPPIMLSFMLLLLPLLILYNFLSYTKRCIFTENLNDKVAVITGSSSGIGEHLAYEYAKKGARLALVATREDGLAAVASKARELGSPDVLAISADVSKVGDCERFIKQTVEHFGKLDHLVNNAGVAQKCLFEKYKDISEAMPVMDINLLGSIYCTYFAAPHLRETKGRIIVITSVAAQIPLPISGIYNASNAALVSLYETLRSEFGTDIEVTIVSSGLTWRDMMKGDLQEKTLNFDPFESGEVCAKKIVKSACRGDMYLTTPSWFSSLFIMNILCPELMNWFGLLFLAKLKENTTKLD